METLRLCAEGLHESPRHLRPGGGLLVTDKVRQLAVAVLREFEANPGQSILCFVEMRITAAALVELLQAIPRAPQSLAEASRWL